MVPHSDDDSPPPLSKKKSGNGCLIGCLVAVVGGFVLVMGLGLGIYFAIEKGFVLPERLVTGEEIAGRLETQLREFAIEEDEQILWYYSTALIDVRADGNLLTDRRVIAFYSDPRTDEQKREEVALADIRSIEVKFESDFAIDQTTMTVFVDAEDPGMLEPKAILTLSSMENRDHTFVEDLVRLAREAGATIDSIEFSGEVSDAEIDRVEGAERVD